jgi:hypothetical protein
VRRRCTKRAQRGGTPLFTRVADLRQWQDWEVSNQIKFVFPSDFDERWLELRISEIMEAFRKKKRSTGSSEGPGNP